MEQQLDWAEFELRPYNLVMKFIFVEIGLSPRTGCIVAIASYHINFDRCDNYLSPPK
jgi:hypothetical protein